MFGHCARCTLLQSRKKPKGDFHCCLSSPERLVSAIRIYLLQGVVIAMGDLLPVYKIGLAAGPAARLLCGRVHPTHLHIGNDINHIN